MFSLRTQENKPQLAGESWFPVLSSTTVCFFGLHARMKKIKPLCNEQMEAIRSTFTNDDSSMKYKDLGLFRWAWNT
jgi:hypothetical protein